MSFRNFHLHILTLLNLNTIILLKPPNLPFVQHNITTPLPALPALPALLTIPPTPPIDPIGNRRPPLRSRPHSTPINTHQPIQPFLVENLGDFNVGHTGTHYCV